MLEATIPNRNLLILEDDSSLSRALSEDFTDRGYTVTPAAKWAEVPKKNFDFAIVDLRLCGEMGLEVLPHLRAFAPNCRIVVLTGYGSAVTAVEAMKRGATDYLLKPSSADTIERALQGKKTEPDQKYRTPTLAQVEHEYIDFLLAKNDGNITKTAKELGLHRQSLQRKLKKYT